MCGEKQRFEKLMEHFRNEDNNIDFMVSGISQELPDFPSFSFLRRGWSSREGVGGVLVAKISQISGFKVCAWLGETEILLLTRKNLP